jgi:hypothetical protein
MGYHNTAGPVVRKYFARSGMQIYRLTDV